MADDYVLVDPGSKLDFSFDWTTYNLAEGDTIAAHQWSIVPVSGSPPAPVLTGDTLDIVFVEGLQAGLVYHLTDRITTVGGVVDERTVVLRADQT